MCAVCKAVNKQINERALSRSETDVVLQQIGKAMKTGKDPEHFQTLLDRVLETEAPESNAELDAAWERSQRRDK